jgi:dipeptidyl aminopeptidase/acylaminoacyl peptidase
MPATWTTPELSMLALKHLTVTTLVLALTPMLAQAGSPQKKKDAKEPEQVSYYRDVRPILQQHCQGCHQPAQAKGGYVMTSYAEMLKKGDHDLPGIVPGQPDKSYVVTQITPHDGKRPAMPRGKDPLTDQQVRFIKRWIAQGAKDDTPASARIVINADHPPEYDLPAVITALAYSPDSKLLAVSGYHEILLHRADGSGLVARLIGESERVQSLAFSPDGKYLAMTGGTPGLFGEVQIWDVAKKKLKLSLPMTFDTVYGVSWSHDGKKVAFGCADNSLRAIEAATGKQILYQGGHSDWVLGTVFSKDSSHLVSVSRDMSMKLTEVSTQRLIDNITSITPGALKGGLMAVARHPKKDELLIGGSDGTPRTYKMYRTKARQIGDDFNKILAFAAMPGRVFSVCYNADGTRVLAGSSDDGTGEVRIYQTDNGKLISTMKGLRGGIYAVAYRPDGKQIASAGSEGVVWLNDPDSGQLVREFVPCPLKTR